VTLFSTTESWFILSLIELYIKEKTERIETPLKVCDIQINYDIKTGFNDTFIIDGDKRNKLITEDPKSEEIIRPILRGRDIKRYSYEFADLWLINTHNGVKEKDIKRIDIEDYPAVKKHLDQFYSQLEKRADKGDTIYNLRNCAYMEDFYSQKIIYPGIMRIAKSNLNNFPRFTLDKKENFFFGNDCYFIVGKHTEYLSLLLNSTLLGYLFRYYIYSFDETGFKIFTDYFKNIPLPLPNDEILQEVVNFLTDEPNIELIDNWVYSIINFNEEEIKEIKNSVSQIINRFTQSQ
jgi:hypothetical protein